MFAIGSTKLQLDDAVGGEETSLEIDGGAAAQKEDKTAKEMRKSLLSTLRNKFEAVPGSADAAKEEEDASVVELKAAPTPAKKVARGATQATPAKKDSDDDVVEIKVDEVKEETGRPTRKKTKTG
jgi:SWI/SNF-related matrix-associated actin-dependent regulator 1 of chromatin subfamily A